MSQSPEDRTSQCFMAGLGALGPHVEVEVF